MFDQAVIERVKLATLCMQRYNWEQGTVAQAFLELGETQTAILLAREAAYRQDAYGRCAQIGDTDACTDPCAIGEALILACEQTGDALMQNALKKLLQWSLADAPRSAEGIVYHVMNRPEFWVDSLYMLPPFLARAGCFDDALRQIDGYWRALYREKEGLLSHIWNDGERRFVREAFWGVGNGWAMAGILRVIALLPERYADRRKALAKRVQGLIDCALRYQRPDGLFHDVLNDPETFVETNFAQMMAYTILRGVRMGILPERYLERAVGLREAVWKKVDAFGHVQEVCGAPSFDKPGVAPEGQAFFLLMEAAWREGQFAV